ncbi:ELWxxDGT repeat protein [Archangium lansingense]|uniref:HYR domain-containing protein n=1 Tax=Archangium lansingense TaxID=2995310 RepID=A0ABT4A7G7_9BACT|nr:ELWxxDGT repeat protein [Archangium lansinium]MCY1077600.1 HYR domain-containing protein [Archangium lansinium]
MRRYWTGVSSLLCLSALATGGVPFTAAALDSSPGESATCRAVTLVKGIAAGGASSFPDYDLQAPTVLGRTAFFAANDGVSGLELWKSRGGETDTERVADVFPGSMGSEPRSLTVVGNSLFFTAKGESQGRELWKTDGTAEGTVLVKDIRSGPEDSGVTSLMALGGTLFFVADDGVHGPELWKSDGTPDGTVLVEDLVPGPQGAGITSLAVLRDAIYFAADGGPHDAELWKSDGTEAGTERVATVRVIESDPAEQVLHGLTVAGDTLYFFAGSSFATQWDLWKSDGSGPGTVRVRSLGRSAADYEAGPVSLTSVGGQIFFVSGAGGSLWRSDGTAEGTSIIKQSSDARFLTNLNGQLLFTAWDDASGFELWRSDGTVAGTVVVEDIRPGRDSSAPFWLTVVDGKVVFSAQTEEAGRELWISDGTREGTALLHDIVPGPGSSEPSRLTVVGPRVFFVTDDGTSGAEPWVLNDCTPPELSCPAEMLVEARGPMGAPVTYGLATASDNKPGSPTVSYNKASGTDFPLGNTSVVATATDESGNVSSCSFQVKVRDSTAPRLTCPRNMEVWRKFRYGAPVNYVADAADAVSKPAISYEPAPGSDFIVGTTQVRVTATDAAGNTSRCSFDVKVRREYDPQTNSGCGCGAASPGVLSGWALLTAVSMLARRRRRSSGKE